MTKGERKALAGYVTAIADALMADKSRAQQNYLTGYASAHLAGLAGLLNVADNHDLSGSIDKDRQQFNTYVVKLLNGREDSA